MKAGSLLLAVVASASTLALFPLAAGCSQGVAVGSSGPVLAAPADSDEVFGTAPAFELLDQSGAAVTGETFAGAPWAVAAIFTRCAGPCPKMTAALRGLQDDLADTDVHLVAVSVDPTFDRPEVLRRYAASYTVDTERWSFLTGTEEGVTGFLKDGLWLPLARLEDPDLPPGERLTHSTKVVTIDGSGALRGWYDVTVAEELDGLRDRLRFLATESAE